MIIHRYIKRKTRDRGLVDNSETEYCCKTFELDVVTGLYHLDYNGLWGKWGEFIYKCDHCKTPVVIKNHYVGEDTLWKHVAKEFQDKVFI